MLHPEKARVTRELRRLARPAGEFDARRYFRGPDDLAFYNIGTQATRALARSIHAAHRDNWSLEDAIAFAEAMIVERHLEAKTVGIEVLARYHRAFTPRLLGTFKRWLAADYSSNWATTDAMSMLLIAPILVRYPESAERMRTWSRHSNMWVRRASIVSLIPAVRKRLVLELAYDIARSLHRDDADLIQKAVGWTLRECGRVNPHKLERYLRANGPTIPRTTVRYAIERFAEARRLALMRATRNGS
jgi:3-methyladenine DNA glycosylase AlkD